MFPSCLRSLFKSGDCTNTRRSLKQGTVFRIRFEKIGPILGCWTQFGALPLRWACRPRDRWPVSWKRGWSFAGLDAIWSHLLKTAVTG